MRKALLATVALLAPLTAFAQSGPMLFANVDIPIYDHNRKMLVDPATQQPIGGRFCMVITDETPIDATVEVSNDRKHWLQAVQYSLDLPHRQIVIRQVWVLNTVKTEQSPGYHVVQYPRTIDYPLDNYRETLLSYRPPDDVYCNWTRILANMAAQQNEATGGGVGGGASSGEHRCWTTQDRVIDMHSQTHTVMTRHCV